MPQKNTTGKIKSKKKKAESQRVKKKRVVFSVKYLIENLNSPINIYDYRLRKFTYVNQKFLKLSHLSEKECYQQNLDVYSSWVNEDDINIIRTTFSDRLIKLINGYVSDKSQKLTFTLNHRLKEHNGITKTVLVQCTILDWDDNLQPIAVLNIYTDITNHQNSNKITLTINLFNEKKQEWEQIHTEEFLHEPKTLTKRETEIICLIAKGNSLEKIARTLFTSYNTMRKHCHHIQKKLKCNSQEELKDLALKEGWV